jgi:hypothetical protein
MDKLVRVKFESRSLDAGFALALHSGSVIFTKTRDEFIIPEESVCILRNNKIAFTTDVTG